MEEIDKRIIFLDCSLTNSTDYTEFSIPLNTPDPFFKCNQDESLYVSPISFSILNDFYNISDENNNNQLTIKKTLVSSPTVIQSFTISLDSGFYDVYLLQQQIQQSIQTGLTNNIIGFTWTTTVNIDPETSFYTIQISSTGFFAGYDLYIEFNTPLAQFLGFDTYAYIKGLSSTNQAYWISTKTPNFLWQNELFIYSNISTKNFENNENGLTQSSLWWSIPIDTPKYALINWYDSATGKLYEVKSSSTFINNLTIKLVDDVGNRIYFKNFPNITLTIRKMKKIEQKENTSLDDIKNLLEMFLLMNTIKEKKSIADISNPVKKEILEADKNEELAYNLLNLNSS